MRSAECPRVPVLLSCDHAEPHTSISRLAAIAVAANPTHTHTQRQRTAISAVSLGQRPSVPPWPTLVARGVVRPRVLACSFAACSSEWCRPSLHAERRAACSGGRDPIHRRLQIVHRRTDGHVAIILGARRAHCRQDHRGADTQQENRREDSAAEAAAEEAARARRIGVLGIVASIRLFALPVCLDRSVSPAVDGRRPRHDDRGVARPVAWAWEGSASGVGPTTVPGQHTRANEGTRRTTKGDARRGRGGGGATTGRRPTAKVAWAGRIGRAAEQKRFRCGRRRSMRNYRDTKPNTCGHMDYSSVMTPCMHTVEISRVCFDSVLCAFAEGLRAHIVRWLLFVYCSGSEWVNARPGASLAENAARRRKLQLLATPRRCVVACCAPLCPLCLCSLLPPPQVE